jgi:hypothetical protein
LPLNMPKSFFLPDMGLELFISSLKAGFSITNSWDNPAPFH